MKYDLAPQLDNSPRRKINRSMTIQETHHHPHHSFRGTNSSQSDIHSGNTSGISSQGGFFNGATNNSFSRVCRMSGFNDDMNLLNFESNQFNLLDFPDHLIDSKREMGSKSHDSPTENTLSQQNLMGGRPILSNLENTHSGPSGLGDITNIPYETSSFVPEYRKTVGGGQEAKEDVPTATIQERKRGVGSQNVNSANVSDQEEISKMKSSGIISQTPARATITKRKATTLKVNIKFEPIVDGLKSGTLETVDLTGAGN